MTPAEALAQGWQLHQAGRMAEAERVYRDVIARSPSDADAWCYLGMICHDRERLAEAESAYRRSLQLRPGHVIVLNNLANTLRMANRTPEALACYDEALQRQPTYVNAYRNKGTALYWDGQLEAALACFRRGLELAPDDAQLHKCLGVALLLAGDWTAGWPEYEWRQRTTEAPLPSYPQPVWDGGSLDGKTILLYGEQGFGDTINFIRYAAKLKARWNCRVIVSSRRKILKLLAGAPGVDALIPREDPPTVPFDVFIPLMSVPSRLGETPADIRPMPPYLTARPELVEHWRRELSVCPGIKIGLAWQGSKDYSADSLRSFPLTTLLPLSRFANVTWFSLQKGDGAEQIETVLGRMPIVPLGERLDLTDNAFLDSAALLKNLDLLITADTALVHVAGALGVPAWLMQTHVPDWRWLRTGSENLWYDSVRLFRQPRTNDWASVVAEIGRELPRKFPTLRNKTPEEYRVASTGLNRVTAAKHGLMLYNRNDIYIGRSLEVYGEFSEDENNVFRQILRPGQFAVEAGANIGAHTLALSEFVGERGRVFAFEPQRIVFQTLCANVALNSRLNVDCRQVALGEASGSLFVPPIDYRSPNNFGGLGLGDWKEGEHVPQITLDSLQLPRCDLLKADVEGMELAVLRGAAETIRRCRPVLYVESDRVERRAELVAFIRALNYRLYWHTPRLFWQANHFQNATNVFADATSFNLLCVHESVKANFQGLKPVEGAGV